MTTLPTHTEATDWLSASLVDVAAQVAEVSQSAAPALADTASTWSQDITFVLGVVVLVFGLIVFFPMVYLLRKGHDANQVLRVCALSLIIVAAMFLIVVSDSEAQIVPAMGLLGMIARYQLGSNRKASAKEKSET